MKARFFAVWGLGLLLALGAGLVAWRLLPVADDDARLVLAAAPLVIWAICLLVRTGETEILRERPGGPATKSWVENGRALAKALRDRSLAGRRRRYRLPLFVVLGPAGMGKSEILRRSGLALDPPVEAHGARWWLGSEAIFVEASTDADDIGELAAALMRLRPACPVNGVLLTLSPADLLLADTVERREMGERIATVLAELENTVPFRPPVHVALTKLDLAPGFVECFEGLEPEERQQTWGFSFPRERGGEASGSNLLESFHVGIRGLVGTTTDRLLDSLVRIGEPRRSGRLLNFGAQVAMMDAIVETVLRPILLPTGPGRKGVILRGVYLTCARCEALTIDALLPELAGRFAIPRSGIVPPDLDEASAETGFFIVRMLREAVLGQAGLVADARPSWFRRRAFGMAATALFLCAAVSCAVGLGLWFRAFDREALESSLTPADRAALVSSDPGAETLAAVAIAVERLDRLAHESWGRLRSPVIFDQPADLAAAHQRALRNSLLPHLTARLSSDLVSVDAEASVLALRLAAASPGTPGHSAALAEWLRQTASSLPEGDARDALLSQAREAFTIVSPAPESVYVATARRILDGKAGRP